MTTPTKAAARISHHAYDRAWERLGWKPRTLERMLPKILASGIADREENHRLKKWFDYAFLRDGATDMRIYGQNAVFFKQSVLITLYEIPLRLRNYVHLS